MKHNLNVNFQPANNKLHAELVVFIHHYGGNYKTSARHIRMLNQLGYDAVSFDLSLNLNSFNLLLYVKVVTGALLGHGMTDTWKQEIQIIADQFKDRQLVIYSFSSLSLGALRFVSENPKHVKAWICDGGPFFDFNESFKRYYSRMHKIKNPALLLFFRTIDFFTWRGWDLVKKSKSALKLIPSSLPILSIRGSRDLLVPESAIQQVFIDQEHLNLSIYTLAKGGHLDGLSRFQSEYKNKVAEFLSGI